MLCFSAASEETVLEPYNLMLDGNSATCMTLNWTQQLVFDLWEKPTLVNVTLTFDSPVSCTEKKVSAKRSLATAEENTSPNGFTKPSLFVFR